jgi:glycine reductase complex component B subunit gamma
MISALGPVASDLGANRVVRGIKIPHPCGDPSLDLAGDHDLRVRLVRGSLKAISTSLEQAAIFDGVAA